jgi:hypothetical protein
MTRYQRNWQDLREGTWVSVYKTPIGWTEADALTGRDLPDYGVGEYLLTEVGYGYARIKWDKGQAGPGVLVTIHSDVEIGYQV